MMKSTLSIHRLQIPVRVGVHDWEKSITQTLTIHLEMEYDAQMAMQTDAIQFALDYTDVAKRIEHVCLRKHYELIEHLAWEIKNELEQLSVISARLEVEKPNVIPSASHVCFTLSW